MFHLLTGIKLFLISLQAPCLVYCVQESKYCLLLFITGIILLFLHVVVTLVSSYTSLVTLNRPG